MTRHSLRFRLLLAAAVSITLALVAAGLGLGALFERHVSRHQEARLAQSLDQILGNLELGAEGRIRLAGTPADPRFEIPLSGFYWQIQDDGHPTLLRSRSLWDQMLNLPGDDLPDGVLHRHDLGGPAGQSLLVLERRVLFRPESEARPLRVAVALDRRELAAARRDFAIDMLPYLVVLGLALVLAAWLQVRVGLAPLERLRQGVRAIRSEGLGRLPPDHPEEVLPLVEELNALIGAQEGAVERARAWTADLAHGLKTPLVALAADAERLRALGQPELADDLEQLAQTMRRRVDRELIRGRIRARQSGPSGSGPSGVAGGPPPAADLGTCLDGVIRTLARTPRGPRSTGNLTVPPAPASPWPQRTSRSSWATCWRTRSSGPGIGSRDSRSPDEPGAGRLNSGRLGRGAGGGRRARRPRVGPAAARASGVCASTRAPGARASGSPSSRTSARRTGPRSTSPAPGWAACGSKSDYPVLRPPARKTTG